jgi:3-isopropylmalate dehydrogenase
MEKAVEVVLQEGYRTADILSEGQNLVSTTKMGDLIAERIIK